MADTNISWATKSWNPLRARNLETGKVGWHCERISPTCERCYAERMNADHRFGHGTGLEYKAKNRNLVTHYLDRDILEDPLHWRRPSTIFACSMTDLFGAWVKAQWVPDVFSIIKRCPQHAFMILTKRTGRLVAFPYTGYNNTWFGFSAENQRWFDRRWEDMKAIPENGGKVWASIESLLGPVDISRAAGGLSYVVVGGESGTRYRPMEIHWLTDIVTECQAAGIPIHVKQDCGPRPGMQGRIADDIWALKAMPSSSNRQSLPKGP